MKEELNGFRQQHEMSYRNAILDTIKNNTEVLVNQDIVSLFQKPPLDSMDLLRTKFLNLAKKNKIVLNTEGLGYLLNQYRSYLLDCCDEIKNIRIDTLSKVIKKEGNGVIQIVQVKEIFNIFKENVHSFNYPEEKMQVIQTQNVVFQI